MPAAQSTALTSRIGLALREALLEHGLSESEVARMAAVSRATVHKLASDRAIRTDLAMRVAAALVVVDVFSTPASLEDELLVYATQPSLPGEWPS